MELLSNKRLKKCKYGGCQKSLASHNKSGYCQYHWNLNYRNAHYLRHREQVITLGIQN